MELLRFQLVQADLVHLGLYLLEVGLLPAYILGLQQFGKFQGAIVNVDQDGDDFPKHVLRVLGVIAILSDEVIQAILKASQVVCFYCLIGPLIFDVLEYLQLFLVLFHDFHLVGIQDDLDLSDYIFIVVGNFLPDFVDAFEQVEQPFNGYFLEAINDVLM